MPSWTKLLGAGKKAEASATADAKAAEKLVAENAKLKSDAESDKALRHWGLLLCVAGAIAIGASFAFRAWLGSIAAIVLDSGVAAGPSPLIAPAFSPRPRPRPTAGGF